MAEQIVNEFTVNRPIEEAWPIICDVERIAPCLPGAQLEEIEGDVYRGKVKVKLGAVTTEFNGEAQFVERDDVAHTRQARSPRVATPKGRGNAAADITAEAEALSPTSTKCIVDRRSPHHRQGRPVRARHHGRRQQEADRPVRHQPQHDDRRVGRRAAGRRARRADAAADQPAADDTDAAAGRRAAPASTPPADGPQDQRPGRRAGRPGRHGRPGRAQAAGPGRRRAAADPAPAPSPQVAAAR